MTTTRKSKTRPAIPVHPGGNLPEFLVWPVLAIIPLICLVGAWTTPPVATPDELKSAVSQILLTALLVVYYWYQRGQERAKLTFTPPVWAFAALFALSTVSVLWAANPDFWFYKWSRWYAGFVMFLFAYQIRQSGQNLDRIIFACLLAGVITAVVGSAQHLFNFTMIPQTAFPASTFGNGNVAGEIMIFTAPLGMYFLCKPDLSRRATWLTTIAMCLIFMYTFYTRTRAVWLAVILEAVLVGIFILLDSRRATWLHWDRPKSIAAITMTLVFLVMINFSYRGFEPFWRVAVFEMTSIVTDIQDNEGEDASARYLIWRSTLEMIADNPVIGAGTGNYFELENNGGYDNLNVRGVQRIHNDVLELAVDLGAAGLLCLAAIIVTFCRQLYLLLLHATGKHRLIYALLTIAVTGTMLEAQLSFPYEMPVPLVMMPLFMAVVIRGAEHFAPEQLRKYHPGTWFNRSALAGSVAMLLIVTVINLQWLQDFRKLNQMLLKPEANQEWNPRSFLMSQAHITAAWSIAQALRDMDRPDVILNIVKPVVEFWPDIMAHTTMMTRLNLQLGRLQEAGSWSTRTIEAQPAGSFTGELELLDIYRTMGAQDMYEEIYTSLKLQPDEALSTNANILLALHFTSMNLQDNAGTQRFYDLYVRSFGELASLEANQAVFLLNSGNTESAVPHMVRALELDAEVPLGEEFRRILAGIGIFI